MFVPGKKIDTSQFVVKCGFKGHKLPEPLYVCINTRAIHIGNINLIVAYYHHLMSTVYMV